MAGGAYIAASSSLMGVPTAAVGLLGLHYFRKRENSARNNDYLEGRIIEDTDVEEVKDGFYRVEMDPKYGEDDVLQL